MKAYVTSIGEKTTEICCKQLQRFGFEVVLLDGAEPWPVKYNKFIQMAEDDCIRIDADVIVNEDIKLIMQSDYTNYKMVQWYAYDFYKNKVGISSPVFYSKEALRIIRKKFKDLDLRRPEASAWRLPAINPFTHTDLIIIGMHGFFQTKEDMYRHLDHRRNRKQIADSDFELAELIIDTLCKN